jgi:CBS domain-containing protein
MTTDVVTAAPQASVAELAGLLTKNRISGIPIVADDARVVGVVSEADLMANVARADRGRGDATAPRASDLMTRPVLSVSSDTSLAAAAKKMRAKKVKRLIVTDGDDRVLGIVSRADLVRAYTRSDDVLRRDITSLVLARTLWIDPTQVQVHVEAGVVTLTGRVGRRSTAGIAARLSARVPGVVTVVNDITYEFDDTALSRSRVNRTHPFSADPFGPSEPVG